MKEQILIDALEKIKEAISQRNFKWNEKYDEVFNIIDTALSQFHSSPAQIILGSASVPAAGYCGESLTTISSSPVAGKGESYPISKRACYSCGEYFNPDTEFGVSVFDGDRKYFYCEKCSGKNEHTKPRI